MKDFVALLPGVKSRSVTVAGSVRAAVLTPFFPERPAVVLFHKKRQQPGGKPDAYIKRKKLLYVAAALHVGNNHQSPKFGQDEDH